MANVSVIKESVEHVPLSGHRLIPRGKGFCEIIKRDQSSIFVMPTQMLTVPFAGQKLTNIYLTSIFFASRIVRFLTIVDFPCYMC